MRGNTSPIALTVCAVFGLFLGNSALADLPSNQYVQYLMYDDPNDPNSILVFAVSLPLRAADADGDYIGWDVLTMDFTEYDPNGSPDRSWADDDPNVPTQDGLWWIEHADPNDPDAGEFTEPPLLQGVALAENYGVNDLDYTFEGVTYTPPASGAHFTTTAAIDHVLTIEGDSTPIQEGDAEPAEVPPVGRAPMN